MTRTRKYLSLACAAAALLMSAGEPVLAKTGSGSSGARQAEIRDVAMSRDVQQFAEWTIRSGDHQRLPFIIVDKVNARASAFDAAGRHIRTTPVLLGTGVGDTFAPGVAEMDMHQTQPWQRITPAGRFFAEEDLNLQGQKVLWVDYDAAIAIHKLPAKRTKQRRHERIRSPNPADHRITYGCINVSPVFYDQVVHPNFGAKGGIVYVLPETMPLKAVFKSYDLPPAASLSPGRQSVSEMERPTRSF
jgi:hypothetical protein